MSKPLQSHRDVIRLLGGPSALARCLGIEAVNTTIHWGSRGVPKGYRQRLSELAALQGVRITSTHWDALPITTTQSEAA